MPVAFPLVVRDTMPAKKANKKKKKKSGGQRGGGGRNKKHGEEKRTTAMPWLRLRQQEMSRLENVVRGDPGWVAFSYSGG